MIKGERGVPKSKLVEITKKFKLDPEVSAQFIESALETKDDLKKSKDNKLPHNEEPLEISDEEYHRLIAEWEYYAVLNVSELDSFENTPEHISERLGINIVKSQSILDDLLRWGMFKETIDGDYIRSQPSFISTNEIPSKALIDCHINELELAKTKLKSIPIELRGFYSGTYVTNKEAVSKAKKMFLSFLKKIDKVLEQGPKNEVYMVSTQLFPLTTPTKGHQSDKDQP